MKKIPVICFDRDGTLIYDKKFHLGSQKDWKKKVKILPNVVSNLKRLRKLIPNAKIYFITNQPGVAVKEMPLLTWSKANEVCKYVLNLFKKKGFVFDGYRVCGKSTFEWAKKHPEFTFDKRLVGNFPCFKPRPGMINDILQKEKLKKKNIDFYILGDRASDTLTAKHFNGWGILVPFVNRPKESRKLKDVKWKKKYSSKSIKDAVDFIIKKN